MCEFLTFVDCSWLYSHAAVEVHAVDTNARVVLDTKIDVLVDTEAEVAGLGEVPLAELVLLDLEATLKDLLGLGATDGDVDGDLFVTTDTEGTDSVAGLAYRSRKNSPISHSIPQYFVALSISSMVKSKNFGSRRPYCRQESDRSAARAP